MPAGPAVPGRVEAKRRALTTPSTAPESNARWCRCTTGAHSARVSRGSRRSGARRGRCARAWSTWLSGRITRHEHRQAGGAFRPDELAHRQRQTSTANDGVNDPVSTGLGPPSGQDTGVVHAIVGSATATLAPVATAAQSAASVTCSRQVAALQALAQRSRVMEPPRGENRRRGVETGGPT